MQTPDQLAGRWVTMSATEIDGFWPAGHCGRDEVSRVVVLLQSKELSVPAERILDVLKQFAMPKRGLDKKYGVMATWESGQLIKGEVRLLGSIPGGAVSGNYELVQGIH